MRLAERLVGLELCPHAVWVFDLTTLGFRWANAAAAELWGADDVDVLLQRDLSDTSDAVKSRLRGYLPALAKNQKIRESWTFYPHGKPVTVTSQCTGIILDDGSMGFLAQILTVAPEIDSDLVRGIEALRHSSALVCLLDGEGQILLRNPACVMTFGEKSLAEWFPQASFTAELLSVLQSGQTCETEIEAETQNGMRWHAVVARVINDPATGSRVILLQQLDVTKQRSAEALAEEQARLARALSQTVRTVQEQNAQILALSAPVLEIADGALLLPIIGNITTERTQAITEYLLTRIVAQKARSVILDLTGMQLEDTESINRLSKLAQAIRLLGAKVTLCGISGRLARDLATLKMDSSLFAVTASLQAALKDVWAVGRLAATQTAPRRS